jgi:phosphoribosylanthranilate isomerase
MGISVKICGINSMAAADAALSAGADYAGLNFHSSSPRYVAPDIATSLANHMRGRTRLVALFADAGDGVLARSIEAARPDLIQLHGKESVARVAEIRSRFGKPVIKAISVAEAGDFVSVAEYEKAADVILFDAKPPKGAAYPGGHGTAFDWQLLRGRSFQRPWMLSGGLTTENVARAIEVAGAEAVDVSSGVESAKGVKDPQMIRDFVAAAKNAIYKAPAA